MVPKVREERTRAGEDADDERRDHKRGYLGEGDFVLAHPTRGLLVLEVKAGRIEQRDGRWFSNGVPLDEAPRDQADTNEIVLSRLAVEGRVREADRGSPCRRSAARLAEAPAELLEDPRPLPRTRGRTSAPSRLPAPPARPDPGSAPPRGSRVPDEPRARVRDRAEKLVRAEIAPGVFLLEEGAETKFAKALAALEVSLRSYSTSRHVSTDREYRSFAAKELGALLALHPAEPADPRVAGPLSRARNGEPGEFARSERPVVNPPARVAQAAQLPAHPADVDDLLDELLERIEAGEKLSLEGIALAARGDFSSQLERVLDGRVAPERLGPGFVRFLERVLGRGRAADRPAGRPGRPAVAAPLIAIDWERVAAEAIAAKQDLWLKIVDEGRPRSVTPHQIARRGEAADLLALAHDSGDLRVFPGHRIQGAAPAGASEPERLPGSGPARAVLRTARNDRCPCGSGRKYKACCLPADLAAGGGG
jgi:SEC-C motif-containing protein